MKKIIFALSIIFAAVSLTDTANAQINVNININSQPAWGASGYDYANFYYFPDLNIYFDINNSLFYYLAESKWVPNRYLPGKYSKYDFYNLYKVVINDNNQPWLNNKTHKKEYSLYKNNKTQISIRNSNDTKYNQSKNNTIDWVNNNDLNKNKNNSSNKDKNKQKTDSQNKNKQSPNRNQH